MRRCPKLPIATRRNSAIPEVVTDGVTGLLVEPGDPAALGSVVDDFTLQTVGTTGMVKAVLGPATRRLLACFEEKRVPVHFGKLCYLTHDAAVAKQLEAEWPSDNGRVERGRLLGNDVHDGRWRCTSIGAQRVEDGLERSRRLQILRRAGAKVATVQRGGPTAAATWGATTTGLAPSVLHGMRVATARAEGPFAAGAPVGLRLRCYPNGIGRDPAGRHAAARGDLEAQQVREPVHRLGRLEPLHDQGAVEVLVDVRLGLLQRRRVDAAGRRRRHRGAGRGRGDGRAPGGRGLILRASSTGVETFYRRDGVSSTRVDSHNPPSTRHALSS